MKKNINILIEKVSMAKSIAIMAHKNPDADALCSVLALSRLIKLNFAKDCVCIYDGNIPDALDNIPLRSHVKHFSKCNLDKQFDLVLLLDYGTPNNVGGGMSFVQNAKYIIEIDHHKNENKLGHTCIDDENAAATGEIIYNIVKAAKWNVDNDVLNLIALAILTDTGFFKFVRSGSVFRIMGELVDSGVNIGKLMSLLNNKPFRAVQTEARVASNAEFFYKRRLTLAVIDSHDYKHIDGRGEIVLNLLNQIKGLEYIVLLKQQKTNQIGVSLRSRTVPINHIAESLGGGGHAFASGAVVHDSLENVRAKILEIFKGI